ncbi:MAG TPA: 3'(2'),5'-bisphosphate nucleotidase CysQ [Stellaceae bacterium]|nr:3'(2'),5'-bisphosphate nucleotidase CysQ [Stellaceae bacterium]
MSIDNRHLLGLALRAAHEASQQILEIYGTNFDVRVKDDRTPVTLADERAEAAILALLAAEAPGIPVVAEEQTAAQGISLPPAPRFWLVDPLDGTREFLKRNGEFTVNIALIEGTRPVLGVVHLPVTGVTYAACGPGTATHQDPGGAPRPITARPAPATGAVVAHSRSHADEASLAAYVATHPGARRLVTGSSAKFCLLASGEADFYPRFGTTMEWDTAAGQAVLEAAGGAVLTLDGTPLAYAKPDYRNPHFIARGRTGS